MSQRTLDDAVDVSVDSPRTDDDPVDRTTCTGCHETMVTFSGQRSYCLRCTTLIARRQLGRRDFTEGRLDECIDGALEDDDWDVPSAF